MSSSSSAVLERKVLSRPRTRVEVSKEKLNPTHYISSTHYNFYTLHIDISTAKLDLKIKFND